MTPEKISLVDGALRVPDEPIIPFIEGDGTGVDIWPASQMVFDAAAAKHGKTIHWKEVLAGQEAFDRQAKRREINCPRCGTTRVEKALMTPSIAKTWKVS